MIAYVAWYTYQVGPLTLQVWGSFVALGAVVGVFLARRAGRRLGLDPEAVADAAARMTVWGFVAARLGHALFYDPAPFLADPLELLRIWHGGFSSIGGFLGALIALALFLRRRKIPALTLADALAHGFPLGWAIGRIGCFLIHDHPGTLSHSLLAVRYPEGSRWDLGLVESLTGLFTALALYLSVRRWPRSGVPTAVTVGVYLTIRFFTDFLRARDLPGSDLRVLGLLTPAQIGSVVLLVLAAVLLRRSWKRGVAFRKPLYP